ncbi:GNAT family N-acetyltransferase [Paenibacillus eucommiae]|uniref:GNAT superfamily N-acetyltransferase n=1 Tax=Paenibacillus eucommiae TaxID=1355755 RepID=A0ABS4J9Z9_9BACL|nr:GNAT family N-acetyltransferase [Paenibacillus eucommiae]MBP1996684.1 GNAT superfamily N-acetyltransferase [Paenibacillus eucommiae]
MSEIEIRWACINDCHDLSIVHLESYRAAYRGIMPDDFLNKMTLEDRSLHVQNLLKTSAKRIAILRVDGATIGYAEVGKCEDKDLDETWVEIFAIYLLKEYSGRGFGSHLMGWVLDKVLELGHSRASLWVLKENTDAIKFYEKLDFKSDGTERVIKRGKTLVQMRFQKLISNNSIY